MPTFQVQDASGTYEIDAPDEATALSAFQKVSSPEKGDIGANTALSTISHLGRGIESGFNPMSYIGGAAGLAEMGQRAITGQKSPLGDFADWAQRNKGYTSLAPAAVGVTDILAPQVRQTLKAQGLTPEMAFDPEAFNKARNVESTPLRRVLGRTAEFMGASVPSAAIGGLGALKYGAASGVTSGLGEEAAGPWGGLAGAILGPMALRGVERGVQAMRQPKPPTETALFEKARGGYETVRNSGAAVDQNTFAQWAGELGQDLQKRGIDPELHKAATRLLTRIEDTATNPKFASGVPVGEIANLRELANDVMGSHLPRDAFFGGRIKSGLDTFTLAPLEPAATEAFTALREANKTYSQAKSVERLQELYDLAQNTAAKSQTPLSRALKQEFSKLIRSGEIDRFPDFVQPIIRSVAEGTGLRTAMQGAGKFTPTHFFPAVLHGLIAKSNPVLGAVTAGTGLASRLGANALAANATEALIEAMRRGAPAARIPFMNSNLARAMMLPIVNQGNQ